ncbi:hypothetical protein MRX96_024381 [Rhipicephalus microplus]
MSSVGDAIKTYFDSWHGFFNITETAMPGELLTACGFRRRVTCCCSLFLYMGTLETDSQKCLMNMCMGYGVNGLLFMVSSVLSNPTAGTLPYIFYYHLFEWTAMLALIICGVKIIADKQGGGGATMQAIVAVLCGSIHAAHSGYIVYRQYIKES